MAGFLLLQLGMLSNSGGITQKTQLAASERNASQAATRGSARTGTLPLVAAQVTATTAPAPVTEAPTTGPPAPPTTAAPKPKPVAAAVVVTTTTIPKPVATTVPLAPSSSDAVWQRLAQCESGMRNDGGAPYYGYFQFSAGTWTGIGGSGLPSDHTYDEQLVLAKKLQARSGWGQWPVCSKVALQG